MDSRDSSSTVGMGGREIPLDSVKLYTFLSLYFCLRNINAAAAVSREVQAGINGIWRRIHRLW